MFDKRKDAPQEAQTSARMPEVNETSAAPASKGKTAVIGPGIRINGDISGDENLIIEGTVDGAVNLGGHQVDIGPTGKVSANIAGRVIKIAGETKGDINGKEKVVISRTGKVRGNIVSPRVTLEDGALFKGSIDMDPGETAPRREEVSKPAAKPSANGQAVVKDNNSPAKDSKPKESSLGL